MKVSSILFYLALLSLFSVPVSADVTIQSSSVIQTNETLILSLDWSPDGNSLAYIAYDDSRRQQIFTINVDGSGKKQVTNTTNKKWGVAWFDEDISYISYDTDGLEKIFLVKPDGSGLRKLLDDGTRQGRAPEDKPPALGSASYNPKTKTVLYTSFDAAQNEKIFEVNLDGTGKKQVINDSLRQWNPEWSPDWNSLVYVSYDSKYIEQLFTANEDGSGKKQITFDAIKKSDPDWGQGGIVYVSYETAASSGQQIFFINPDGSGEKLLFKNGFRELNPMWSRDGTKIVFTAIDPQGNQTFMVLNLQNPAATTSSPTPTPTATSFTPTPIQTSTPTGTPEIKETPVKSTINNVVSSMLLVLGLIVVVMLVILFISNLMNKKK
ncbi:MAG: hypothetical protein WCE94_06055 [Candidatus Methanoperedens sp.]